LPGNPTLGTPAATSPTAAATQISTPAPAAGAAAPASGIGGFLKDNSWLVPAAALAFESTKANAPLPNQSQLQADANQLNASAKQLENYLSTGTLPPGLQAGITQASASAKAAIRSQYAAIGNSGSSAEAQDLAAVDSRADTQGSQIALSLLQQGVSQQGMADQLYMDLMNTALSQDQALGNAIGTFASSLVPSAPTITLKAA
jgi:hypothetical protein